MVKNGHAVIPGVQYAPPAGDAAGVEVVTLAELHRRMQEHQSSPRAQRPDFHLLLTVDRGVIVHMVDFHDHVVADGAWLLVRPGQVQRFGDLSSASGSVVMFPAGTLPATTAAEASLDDPFGRMLWTPAGAEGDAVRQALAHLTQEYGAGDVPEPARSAILRHLLAVLVLRVTNLTTSAGTPRGPADDTFLRFRAAVEKGFAEHRDVAHYARRLGYAPRTLTRATIEAAGVGAKEFIDQRVILEAKRLLAHTDDPAASIAARLGFPDASNFVKYFALRANATPTAFRAQFRSGAGQGPAGPQGS
ncbi:helix-turn-helix domain-containing protein [Kribbia dieselivorans]|uniref:helix-turn-helix domain-containing protein n=1 Tax=Kribbia dieselivorans TaxID=331526 RepID=UPI000837C567|nr:AraC family transcriptional regulator [Kribbia dieselivorans]